MNTKILLIEDEIQKLKDEIFELQNLEEQLTNSLTNLKNAKKGKDE